MYRISAFTLYFCFFLLFTVYLQHQTTKYSNYYISFDLIPDLVSSSRVSLSYRQSRICDPNWAEGMNKVWILETGSPSEIDPMVWCSIESFASKTNNPHCVR